MRQKHCSQLQTRACKKVKELMNWQIAAGGEAICLNKVAIKHELTQYTIPQPHPIQAGCRTIKLTANSSNKVT